jgi:serine protease Do
MHTTSQRFTFIASSSLRRRAGVASALAIGAASLILGTAALSGGQLAHAGTTSLAEPTEAMEHANALSKAFRHAARNIQPSVVSIEAVKKMPAAPAMRFRGGPGAPGMDPEEFFRRHFGQGGGPEGALPFGPPPGAMPEMRGGGSGVIVAGDGYIITNNHVVTGADKLTVTLDDGRTFDATLVGADPESDLALIKVEGTDLPAATLGDSDELEAGDWVVAVGSPYGLDKTVTAGIVSATKRRNMGVAVFENFIQTDAAINPGNSGGPLVNLKGEVIGINTAIRSGAGGNDGIGFAIPVTTVRSALDGLRAGKVERGYLGVRPQMLDQHLASSFGFEGKGVLVADVVAGEPGQLAGLEAGDIIVRVDGTEVDSPSALVNAIGGKSPGDAVHLDIVRQGTRKSLEATLGARPGALSAATPGGPTAPHQLEGLEALGLRVESIGPENRERFQLGETAGVVVSEVAPDSRAAKAGLQPGDVILDAAGRAVESPSDLAASLDASGDKPLRLRVKTGDMTRFTVIR